MLLKFSLYALLIYYDLHFLPKFPASYILNLHIADLFLFLLALHVMVIDVEQKIILDKHYNQKLVKFQDALKKRYFGSKNLGSLEFVVRFL